MPDLTTALFGAFLIAHGLVHLAWVAPKPRDAVDYPFELERSWAEGTLSSETLATLGATAAVVACISFVIAGLGVLGVPLLAGFWRVAAVIGVVTSLDVNVVFWRRWFVALVVIDVGILAAAVVGWPPAM